LPRRWPIAPAACGTLSPLMPPAVPPPPPTDRAALRWLLLLWLAFATHGSLYPWQFAAPTSLALEWERMMHQPSWWTGGFDVLGNIVLFVPVGALGWRLWCDPSRGRAARALALLAGGWAFAFALQLVQLYLPARDAQWSDVVWNTVGLVLGMVCSPRLPLDALTRWAPPALRLPATMALLWGFLQWWPLAPFPSRRHIAYALQWLWQDPRWSPMTVLQVVLSLAVLGAMARAVNRRLLLMLGCVAVALAGRLVNDGQVLSLSDLVGLAAGVALAAACWRLPERAVAVIGVAVAALYAVVKALRVLGLQAPDGTHPWWAALLRASSDSPALAWGWILYWSLCVVILARIAARAGGNAPLGSHVLPSVHR